MMPTLTPAITFPRSGIARDAQLDDVIAGHVLWCEVGSTMYGIGTGTDDRDEMVVFVEPPHVALGLDGYETIVRRSKAEGVRSEAGDLDVVAHTLRKFVRLAAKGNPSILAALWCPDAAVMAMDTTGLDLRTIRGRFSTKQSVRAFLGYIREQRERMTGERGQKKVKRPELVELYSFDTKYAGHALRLGYQGLRMALTGGLDPILSDNERIDVLLVRTGGVSEATAIAKIAELESLIESYLPTCDLPESADREYLSRWAANAYRWKWDNL